MTKIIFLGGIPGTGKTTLAYKIALKYKIDKVISLDILKTVLNEYENDPYINTTTHEAYKIDNLTVTDGFLKHSKIINGYFYKFIKKFNDKIIIVEGATITKEFTNLFIEDDICYINLVVDDIEELIRRYKEKLKIRKSKWLDNLDTILKINDFLKEQADKNINSINDNEVEEYINESLFL